MIPGMGWGGVGCVGVGRRNMPYYDSGDGVGWGGVCGGVEKKHAIL